MTRSIRLTLILLLLFIALVFGAVIARQVYQSADHEPTPPPDLSHLNAYVYDKPQAIAEFDLLDENGAPFTPDDLKGHWTFAFVGYTNCPDICPAAMASLRQMDSLLPKNLPQPEHLLITSDPEHDTPSKLSAYVGFFGENFHGATGDIKELRILAKSLGAAFMHRQVEGELLVEHSGHFALLNPDGEMIAVLQLPHKPENLAEAFAEIYEWAKANHPRASQPS